MIFGDFLKALGQIDDRAFRGVMLRSLGLTILLLAGFVWGTSLLLGWLLPDTISLPWFGEVTFIETLASGLGVGAALILSVFLMVPVASLFIGVFLEEIAAAVETKHYPALPSVGGAPFLAGLSEAVRFLGLLVAVNLLALVLYLIFAPLAPLIFWLVNGLLLGREYFQLVALRRLKPDQAKSLRRRHVLQIWLAGTLMAVPLTVPVLNLVVPILGVATFTHLFHRLNRG